MVINVKKHIPKDVMCFVSQPKRRLAEFMVELKNVPGALAETSDLLFKHKVNILTGIHIVMKPEVGHWVFFADFTEATETPKSIAKKLEELDKVLKVEYHEAENFIVESFLYPVISWDWRFVIMNAERLSASFTIIKELLGSGAAALLFYQGFEYGSNLAEWIKEAMNNKIKPKDLLNVIIKIYRTNGWGNAEVTKFNLDEKKCVIKVYDCFESLSKPVDTMNTTCDFNRGFWSGALTKVFKMKMKATESKCAGKGDDYCEFIIKPWA